MAKSNAERQAEYRERKRKELEAEGLPERQADDDPVGPPVETFEPGPGERDIEQLLVLPVGSELTSEEEQLLRDHFGYTASEKRSRVEREAAADGARRALPDHSSSPSVTSALKTLRENEDRLAVRSQAYRDSLKS